LQSKPFAMRFLVFLLAFSSAVSFADSSLVTGRRQIKQWHDAQKKTPSNVDTQTMVDDIERCAGAYLMPEGAALASVALSSDPDVRRFFTRKLVDANLPLTYRPMEIATVALLRAGLELDSVLSILSREQEWPAYLRLQTQIFVHNFARTHSWKL